MGRVFESSDGPPRGWMRERTEAGGRNSSRFSRRVPRDDDSSPLNEAGSWKNGVHTLEVYIRTQKKTRACLTRPRVRQDERDRERKERRAEELREHGRKQRKKRDKRRRLEKSRKDGRSVPGRRGREHEIVVQ